MLAHLFIILLETHWQTLEGSNKTPGTALAETAAATGGVAENTVAELTENPTATMAILGALAVGGTAGKMDDKALYKR